MPSPLQVIEAFPHSNHQVTAFFTTRLGGVSSQPFSGLNLGWNTQDDSRNVDRNWKTVKAEKGLDPFPVISLKQIHSDIIINADTVNSENILEGDALYTSQKRKSLAVFSADCLPVLLFDPTSQTIGAIHSGWKGTSLKILFQIIQLLKRESRLDVSQTLLAFGPCISSKNYEIGLEVAEHFPKSVLTPVNNKFTLNLQAANKLQALEAGVHPENISEIAGCTFNQPELFYSYRREGLQTGRMAGVICMNK